MKNTSTLLAICSFLFVSSAFASLSSDAIYLVPVEANLEGANEYTLVGFEFEQNSNGTYLTYELPAALVGHSGQKVEFFGNAGAKVLTGKDGQAECHKLREKKVCRIELTTIGYDPRAISEVITHDFPQREYSARMQVAKKFAGEHVGFVIYK